MTAQEMWKYCGLARKVSGEYQAWAFGDDPDTLAELVLQGIKTATASAYPFYELENEPLPQAGEYSVIVNARNEAVCVIRTEEVTVCPFNQVGEQQAWKEGEGDRTLEYWRKVHRKFFAGELEAVGLTFDEEMPVVCEEFVRVYP